MNVVARQIEEHIPALQRYALSLARNGVVADDLVQDCVVRALIKSNLYTPGTNLRAWLFTILHNLHVSQVRKDEKWKQPTDMDGALAKLSVPASQPSSLMLRAVRRAMLALPDQQRMILYRVGVEGRSYEEVSDELDIPIGTVKSRCYRARKSIREGLDGKDEAKRYLSLVA